MNSTIKAHLIRSAFYLLLAVCAIPFALAQPRNRGTTKQSVAKPTVSSSRATNIPRTPILPVSKLPAATLYDQLNNPGTNSTSSQDFEVAYAASDDFAADDFVVPGGQTWNITEVDAQGVYSASGGPAVSFNVFFYRDSSGVPGTNLYTATGQSYINNSGVFQISLTVPAVLSSGTYWVSVQARMDYNPNGQWYWIDRTVQANSPATWQNPSGGFGVCPTWAVRTTCVGDPPAPDQMFRLIGTIGTLCGTSRYDFNGDGYPDLVLYNVSTLQTEIMYLNNNIPIGTASGPTLPAGWSLIDEDDFNGDGYPDYLVYNPSTGLTAIAYMNNNVVIGVAFGPTLPLGWQLIAAGDFNGDCEPDYVVYYPPAHVTVIAYMNNNVVVGVAVGPTLPTGFNLVGVADFNGDGNTDDLLFNPTTGQTEILYLNNNVVIGSADGPTLPIGWPLEGTADFDRDGKPDYVVYYPPAHVTVITYMNNNVVAGVAVGPTLPTGWVPSRDDSALCEFRLTPTSANALQGGGFGSFVVGCNYSTCEWSAESEEDWITLIGTTSYSGSNTILYSVGPNPPGQPARPGYIFVVPADDPSAELVFTVNQAGSATPTPTPGNLSGTWVGTMTVTAYCNTTTISNLSVQFTQTGSTFTGTFSVTNLPCYGTLCEQSFLDQSGTIDNGTINGNDIDFAMNSNSGGSCFGDFFQDTFTGTLDPDGHIRGNISAGTVDLHR